MPRTREGIFLKKIIHFHYMTYMATPLHKNPWVEKKIFKEIMHFPFMTYMATPLHKNLRGYEIYNSYIPGTFSWSSLLR